MLLGARVVVTGRCVVPAGLQLDGITLAIVSERVGWLDDAEDAVRKIDFRGDQLHR